MQDQNFIITILVDEKPANVFKTINNVAAWWTGEPGVEGSAVKTGDEFSYRYKSIHYSRQKVTELVPGQKIVWLVTDSRLSFIQNTTEWTGTTISFEIFQQDNKTAIRFMHAGLAKSKECYTDCSNAWSAYITGSLKNFITQEQTQAG